MPKRWLDPAFFTDEKMKRATVPERLLAAAIIANQDDDGRLKGDPAYLRAIAFLYDDYSLEELKEMRDHLAKVNPNVTIYQNAGDEYIQLRQHAKYQKPRYYNPSRFPPPQGWQPPSRQIPIVIPEKKLSEVVRDMLTSGQLLLNNEKAASIHEQQRVGNSYIDILVKDLKDNIHIIELKRSALSNKHREQVCDYAKKLCDKLLLEKEPTKILIGTALSPSFSIDDAKGANVNVITIDRDMNLSQLVNVTVNLTVRMTSNLAVTPWERDRERDKGKGLDLDKGKGLGKGLGTVKHPSPSPVSIALLENFPKAFGSKPNSRELAYLRDIEKEISAAGATAEQVYDAYKEAAVENKLHLSYVRAILLDWLGIKRERGPP